MVELLSLKYSGIRLDIRKHNEKMAKLSELLREMSININYSLVVRKLLEYIKVQEFLPIVATIKTLKIFW